MKVLIICKVAVIVRTPVTNTRSEVHDILCYAYIPAHLYAYSNSHTIIDTHIMYCTYRRYYVYTILYIIMLCPCTSASSSRGSLESVHIERRVYILLYIFENEKKVMKCSRGYDPNTFFMVYFIM